MSSTSRKRHDDRRQHHHDRAKKSKKHRSRHVSSSSEETGTDSDEDSSSPSSDDDDTGRKKLKKSSKKKRYHESKKRKTSKHDKKHKHKKRKKEKQLDTGNRSSEISTFGPAIGPAVPSTGTVHAAQTATPGLKSTESSQKSSISSGRSMVPMTKEQYEKQQSIVRRVFDPDTGRSRLVKGDGEIVEEIVSREQQKAINKRATLGDSLSFQAGLKKYM